MVWSNEDVAVCDVNGMVFKNVLPGRIMRVTGKYDLKTASAIDNYI